MGVIQRQSLYNTVIIYTGILIGFINMLYIQPFYLLPEEIGLTRVLYSFSSLLSVILPLGAANILIRFFANNKNEKGHNGFIGYVLFYAIICYLIFAIGLFASKNYISGQYAEQSKLFADNFWLVFPLSFFLTFLQIINVYSSLLSRSVFPSVVSEVFVRLLNILVVVLYHFGYLNFNAFILSFTAIYGLNLLAVSAYVFVIDRPKLRFSFKAFDKISRKTMFRYAILMTIAAMASLGLKNADMVILGKYDLKAAGIYSIALFIGLFIETPLSSLDRIAGARMAIAIAHKNQKEISDIYHKSSTNLFLIGGLLFLGVNTCITPLLSFLPEIYRGKELIVLIVSMGSLVNMASGSNTSIIYNSDHYRKGTALLAGVFIFLIILLRILVPMYGILGAAISIAIGTTVFNLSKMLFIRRYFNMQPFGFDSLKLLMVITALAFAGYYLPNTISPNFMGKTGYKFDTIFEILYRGSVICGGYLGIAFLLKLIPEELLKPARKYLPFINW